MNNQKEIILLEGLGYKFPKENSKQKRKYGIYKCHCGNKFETRVDLVNCKNTVSCGCTRTKHNLRSHRLYKTWAGMINRCNNPKHKRFKDYGARGISVCNEWLSIENFISDMYPSYKEGLSIDRIDNNKGYSKENCRWADAKIQARNTRKLRVNNTSGFRGVIKYGNKFKSVICINYQTIKIGIFDTAIEAAQAYDNYVSLHNLEHTKNS